MIRKILMKDLSRNKIITLSLFGFILLSALLTATSVSIFTKLSSSLDSFFAYTIVPDFVQMHAGEYDQGEIDTFVSQHSNLITQQQTVQLLNIKGTNIFFNQYDHSEENSIMDIAFVKQNKEFDFLINDNNEIVQLNQGEVAVPVYYQQRDNLQINDLLYINCQGTLKEYKIVDFIKDVQMNASIISSKRILVSDRDYHDLESYGEPEYLIEFLSSDASSLEIAYQNSSLPHNGTTITRGLLVMINLLMDSIIAAILLAMALLLMGIAFLCLRFTILMTLEEDVKEIGVMKAIGISQSDIQRLYMGKYIALTVIGCAGGYLASFLVHSAVFKNIQLYMGVGPSTLWTYLLPILAVTILSLLILAFCKLILSKMDRITPMQALRDEFTTTQSKNSHYLSLKQHCLPVSLLLSLQDLWSRKKLYLSVFFVVMLSSFLMIVPYNLQSTMDSRDFIQYMGIGDSDLRMDIMNNEDIHENYLKVERLLNQDHTVETYASYTTYKIDMKNSEGEWENLQVETGDFTKFPLTYLNGNAPTQDNDIAISYAIANEQALKLNDTLDIQVNNHFITMKICGVYQDITNGGKSAKANMSFNGVEPLRHMINVNFKSQTDITQKLTAYSNQLIGVKITDTQGYVSQTLSGLNEQIHMVVTIALCVALIITVFQISLFLKMLLKKDENQNTIMKCIGFTEQQLQFQYILRMMIVSVIGIIAGTILANVGGEYMLGMCMQGMGITRLEFVIMPWMTYFILPLFLLSGVGLATVIATRKMKNLHIADLNRE